MALVGKSLNQETIEQIKREGIPVIIFGVRSVAEALFYACRKVGIKVECFCDNNINRTKASMYNLGIIHTSDLKNKYKEAIFLISAADIKDVINQLNALGYSKWYPSGVLLRDFDIYQYQFSSPVEFMEYAVSTCLLCHDNYLTPDKLFLRSVDIIITERCSLKCRDCSNLMQYYQKPTDCDIKELIPSIDTFCDIIDEVNEFRVLGGEPFMNRDFDLIIKRLSAEPKVRKTVIYTNGTIIPADDKIKCLRNNKVLLIITDYGKLSRNLNALIQKLSSSNIAFYVQRADGGYGKKKYGSQNIKKAVEIKSLGWTDCAKIGRHYRALEGQKEIFKNCCAKNVITISDGKLYRCPFSANATRLRAVPDFENDYINFFQEQKKAIDIYEMKKKIRAFLLEKDFLEVCDYCNGRSFGDPEIQPAIQVDKPLRYHKYLAQ